MKPNENGLGIAHVIDTLNSIYGKDFIKNDIHCKCFYITVHHINVNHNVDVVQLSI